MTEDLQTLSLDEFRLKYGVNITSSEFAELGGLSGVTGVGGADESLTIAEWRTRYGDISDMDWLRMRIPAPVAPQITSAAWYGLGGINGDGALTISFDRPVIAGSVILEQWDNTNSWDVAAQTDTDWIASDGVVISGFPSPGTMTGKTSRIILSGVEDAVNGLSVRSCLDEVSHEISYVFTLS